MGLFSNIKTKMGEVFGGGDDAELSDADKEYVELDTSTGEAKGKAIVRPFVIEDFTDIKQILDVLREGNTIALINIKPLKDKDIIELKRAINKLKKTSDAIDGDIAGFGEDYVVATPNFARIYRTKPAPKVAPQQAAAEDDSMEE